MERYIPLMSDKEIKKRRKWQEKVYSSLKKVNKKKEFEVFGKKFIVLPGMFAPLWGDSVLFAKTIQKGIHSKDFVLDLGTGTGIQGIFAAENSSKVISSDINPQAVKCAKANIKKLGLTKKIKVRQSNLFENIPEKFDVILFNPPFRWFKPRDMLERGEVDEDYKTLNKFFSEVKKHLNEKGKILIVFSDSGDVAYLNNLIKKEGFKFKIINKECLNGWNYFVYQIILEDI